MAKKIEERHKSYLINMYSYRPKQEGLQAK